MTEQRESLASRLGFILLSAGCAIGLGNVWRFPYITGKYGGALFVLVYLFFLIALGLPIMVMEFSIGRASKQNIGKALKTLQPEGKKWHLYGPVAIAGNYILMMFLLFAFYSPYKLKEIKVNTLISFFNLIFFTHIFNKVKFCSSNQSFFNNCNFVNSWSINWEYSYYSYSV